MLTDHKGKGPSASTKTKHHAHKQRQTNPGRGTAAASVRLVLHQVSDSSSNLMSWIPTHPHFHHYGASRCKTTQGHTGGVQGRISAASEGLFGTTGAGRRSCRSVLLPLAVGRRRILRPVARLLKPSSAFVLMTILAAHRFRRAAHRTSDALRTTGSAPSLAQGEINRRARRRRHFRTRNRRQVAPPWHFLPP
jgi:hypothetical protein